MAYDVIVIGAGQAGLAAGYWLRQAGLSFVILEAGPAVAGSWPRYYDSLTLFSPARFCALPGLPMEGDQERYPHRDEVAAYLARYAEHFALPVRTGARVESVERDGAGWSVTVAGDSEPLRSAAVVAATGGFGSPFIPRIEGASSYRGTLLHVAHYRRPDAFHGQRVVVVGAGNSAVQVAVELAEVADVSLATREPVRFRSQAPLGVDIHYWTSRSGLDWLPLGRKGAKMTPVLDTGRYAAALAAGRPDRRPMFSRFTRDGVVWADGAEERVDTVVLATGYVPNLGYIPAEAFDGEGRPAQRGGVSTSSPGLAYVGLPGQRGLASATLRGVGPDARRVVRRLERSLAAAPAVVEPAAANRRG